MDFPDVNVLINAHRREQPDHERVHAWLMGLMRSGQGYAISQLVAVGFICIVTALKDRPTPRADAFTFIDALTRPRSCHVLTPGVHTWDLFRSLCDQADLRGGVLSDAYHAALAVEYGCTVVTADGDFARFPGVRWRHPLQAD